MNVLRETIDLPDQPHAMGWRGNQLVCYENGKQYYPTFDAYPAWRGMSEGYAYEFGCQFDRAITSPDGKHTLLYTNLGTKGLLLRGPNHLIREVNRSYYCADVYEYPAAFYEIDGRTYLIHCPLKYCRLDFEDVETGRIITMTAQREPQDFFHSRLEISPDGRFLISKGWRWHPLDLVSVYTIQDCLKNPHLLDKTSLVELETAVVNDPDEEPESDFEFCTAGFLNESQLLTVRLEENKSLYWWDLEAEKITHKMDIGQELGNLFVFDESWAWDLFRHPKLINLKTGKIEWEDTGIDSGNQNSSITGSSKQPSVAWNRETGKLAIGGENRVDVLSLLIS